MQSQSMRWAAGGMVGAAVGALAWALVTRYTGYEIGWVAWIIGGVVGLGVRVGAGKTGATGMGPGVVAVGCAVLGVLAGKYFAVSWIASSPKVKQQIDSVVNAELTKYYNDEYVISYIADDIVEEYQEQGRALRYPEGANLEDPSSRADYPSDVWRRAERTWNSMSVTDQIEYRDALRERTRALMHASYNSRRGEIAVEAFRRSFNAFDILWIVLAVLTAWRIGSAQSKP
jgi:hypothetical protein